MLYGYGKHGEGYCKCLCDCGNEVIKSAYNIRHSRNPAHCGCMKEYYRAIQSEKSRVDLTGQRFGRLVVTDMIYEKNKHTIVRCICDCGNVVERVNTYLTTGDTTSCGCYQREKTSNCNTKDFTGIVSNYGIRFIKRHHQKNGNGGVWYWECECKCGNKFIALPAKVLNGHITSCGCAVRSARERLISSYLDEIGVDYEIEYKFKDCKDTNPLPFDFYLPSFNTAIEYQGQQHYRETEGFFGGANGLFMRKYHDQIKRDYCKNNGIRLLELPYTMSDDEIKNIIQTLFIRRDCNG